MFTELQPRAGSGAGIEMTGGPEPMHSKLYSVGAQASEHVTVSPAGVVMVPSGCSTDPFGTWQIWNIDLGVHPLPDPGSNVLAAAGQSQAGMSMSCLCAPEDEPQAARDTPMNIPTAIAQMRFTGCICGGVRMAFLLRTCAAVKRAVSRGAAIRRDVRRSHPLAASLQARLSS